MSQLSRMWRSHGLAARALYPVSLLYALVVRLRRELYARGWMPVRESSVPVVVVGNISVGGTGKSPLTLALVEHFSKLGWQPGIVSRGYGGEPQQKPVLVSSTSSANQVGDEPVMHALQSGVPVCVCIHRALAVDYLARNAGVSIIFSDDGLQHYAMARDIEIAVLDAATGTGNGWLLPAGPLREPINRLNHVDLIAVHRTPPGYRHNDASHAIDRADGEDWPSRAINHADRGDAQSPPMGSEDSVLAVHASVLHYLDGSNAVQSDFHLAPQCLINLVTGEKNSPDALAGQAVHAVAGIGRPERFFATVAGLAQSVTTHPKPDHHLYSADDIQFDDNLSVVVTSKDAVKIRQLLAVDLSHIQELRVQVKFSPAFTRVISTFSEQLAHRYNIAL